MTPHRALRGLRPTEARLVFLLFGAFYIAVGAVLVFRYNSIPNDTIARLANGYYVLFSRDPHLAAIGFVWNPLPSLSVLPLLPLKEVWPALTERAFAANIVSALTMAGSVVVFRGVLADFGLPATRRLLLCALYGLNPMIVYYGANGMSEGLFFLILMLVVRHMARWLEDPQIGNLVHTGMYLALAYLTRSEALASVISVIGLVAVVSFARAGGDRAGRTAAGMIDAVIVGMPAVLAFVGWALMSWIIVGHPFEQFSSVYGTASQLGALGPGIAADEQGRGSASRYVLEQVSGLAPLLPLAVALAAARVVIKRDLRAIAPVAVFGAVLTFGAVAAISGQTAGFLRYMLSAVPLLAVLCGFVVSGRSGRRLFALRGGHSAAHVVAGAVLLGVSIPLTWNTMLDRTLGREEAPLLSQVVPDYPHAAEFRELRRRYETERELAKYLDARDLPPGSVALDVSAQFAGLIVLSSSNPEQFVIPPDRDFASALREPGLFGVRYLITQPETRLGALDAINREFPGLYESTDGRVGTLVKEFTNRADGPDWRLFEVSATATGQPG